MMQAQERLSHGRFLIVKSSISQVLRYARTFLKKFQLTEKTPPPSIAAERRGEDTINFHFCLPTHPQEQKLILDVTQYQSRIIFCKFFF